MQLGLGVTGIPERVDERVELAARPEATVFEGRELQNELPGPSILRSGGERLVDRPAQGLGCRADVETFDRADEPRLRSRRERAAREQRDPNPRGRAAATA